MNKYDDLFDEVTPERSVFTDKGALDPLSKPDEIIARDDEERQLASILQGSTEGYLPTTITIYGPPGTGKTVTTRRVCDEFARRHEHIAAEYVNLKECRTIFSAANEIHATLTGEKKGAYEGLDGVFEGIWTALADYPEHTVLILDEIDHIAQDSNYDPSDFFYRLLRGEGKLSRGITLSAWLISNELLEVDLQLDSRVKSAMGKEQVFFSPYDPTELTQVVTPRIERAFRDEAIDQSILNYGVDRAAARWGDARKTLILFRRAGETANERNLTKVTQECIDDNLDQTDKEGIVNRVLELPTQHFFTLEAVTGYSNRRTGEIVQPVTSSEVRDVYEKLNLGNAQMSERGMRDVITDLETMGLVRTWVESRGNDGRAKQIETTFDPMWVKEIRETYYEQNDLITLGQEGPDGKPE